MPEFSIYSFILFIHVLSAIVLMGSTLHAPLARGLVLRARALGDLRQAVDLSRRAAKWNPLAALALLGSGLYLGSWGWWSQAWFYVAIAAWIADTALAIAVINRSEDAMSRLAGRDADGPITPELHALRQSGTWTIAHAVMLANDVAILYAMFVKPELTGSIALLAIANAVALGAVTLRRRSAPHVAGERTPAVSA